MPALRRHEGSDCCLRRAARPRVPRPVGIGSTMSSRYVVRGGRPLSGTVRAAGMTKNAGLKQVAAALLARGTTVLRNVTPVADLDVMIDLVRGIGADVDWVEPDELRIHIGDDLAAEAPYDLVSR